MDEAILNHLNTLVGDGYPEGRMQGAVDAAKTIVARIIGRPIGEDEPDAIYLASAMVAANILTTSDGGPIVSETVGQYSYTRANPGSGKYVSVDVLDLLSPYQPRVYTVETPSVSHGDW